MFSSLKRLSRRRSVIGALVLVAALVGGGYYVLRYTGLPHSIDRLAASQTPCMKLAQAAAKQAGYTFGIETCTLEKLTTAEGATVQHVHYADINEQANDACMGGCTLKDAVVTANQKIYEIPAVPSSLNDSVSRFYYGCNELLNQTPKHTYDQAKLTLYQGNYYWLTAYTDVRVDMHYMTCVLNGQVLSGSAKTISRLHVAYEGLPNTCAQYASPEYEYILGECIAGRAIAKSNPQICADWDKYAQIDSLPKATGGSAKNGCYARYADGKQDVTVCNYLPPRPVQNMTDATACLRSIKRQPQVILE